MVIEDDPGIAGVLQIILEQRGCEVCICADGAIKDTDLKKGIDLIFLDYWLPKSTGDKIARHLKKKNSTKKIPIVMMSALNNIDEVARTVGAEDYIQKPFAFDQLIHKVDKYL